MEEVFFVVSAILASDKKHVVVRGRGIVFDSEECVVAKYGLNALGEWVLVEEGQKYPEECILPAGPPMFMPEEL